MTKDEIQEKIYALWEQYRDAVYDTTESADALNFIITSGRARKLVQQVTQAAERAVGILEQIEKLEAEAKALKEKSA